VLALVLCGVAVVAAADVEAAVLGAELPDHYRIPRVARASPPSRTSPQTGGEGGDPLEVNAVTAPSSQCGVVGERRKLA
jgi:hypothetical protein